MNVFLRTELSTKNLSLDISDANIYKVTNAKFSIDDEDKSDFCFNEWYTDVCFGEFIHNIPNYNLISCNIYVRIYKKYVDNITIDYDTTVVSDNESFIDNKKYFTKKEMSDILDIVKSEVVPDFDYEIKDSSKNYITIKLSMHNTSKAETMFVLNMVRRFYRFNFASELRVAYDFYKDRKTNFFRKCSLIDILTIFDYFLFYNTYADDLLSNGSFGLPILLNKHAFTPKCLHEYNYISEYLFHNVKYLIGEECFYPVKDIKDPKDNPFNYDCMVDEYNGVRITTIPIDTNIFQRLIIYRYKISNEYLFNSIEFNSDDINEDNMYKSYCYHFKKYINYLTYDFVKLKMISI